MKNPVLVTMNDSKRQLDTKHLEKMHGLRKAVKILEFEKKARADPSSRYDASQPFKVPTLYELVKGETRIDINWPVPVEDDKDNEKQ